MHDPRGSVWHKWDLHVHTPASLVNGYGSVEPWEQFIDALSRLPPELKVLGINDYIFLDGYKRVLEAKQAGKLSNIELLLPVIEVRLDKFGGSQNRLSRVNYHVIFSDQIGPDVIESQFLGALISKYVLTPEFDHFRTSGRWAAVPTRSSLEDLGRLIIDSVPAERRAEFGSPLQEGFNNLCFGLTAIQDVIASPYFAGRTLTAVGKTEWADVKWNDHSIADKKTIINGVDLVFVASETPEAWAKTHRSLTEARVNATLLDCSDAHTFADSPDKDRLANCFTWVKADPTFEGLRQAIIEYPSRIYVGDNPPLEPILQVAKVRLSFPQDTVLLRNDRSDPFCFRGHHEFHFSPYFTCIVGGRGTGKSTLLNLLHERVNPRSTTFFKENRLSPTSAGVDKCVSIAGVDEQGVVEFLQQNEIEQFATDHKRLTVAIFARLAKLDANGELEEKGSRVGAARAAIEQQRERILSHHKLLVEVAAAERELETQRGILASFEDATYQRLNSELGIRNRELQRLKAGKARFHLLVERLAEVLGQAGAHSGGVGEPETGYDAQVRIVVDAVQAGVAAAREAGSLGGVELRERGLDTELKALREQLDAFLTVRGLSRESLSDVGKASERIAQLEAAVAATRVTVAGLSEEIVAFTIDREAATKYGHAVERLLAPINDQLKGQGSEVKPIELRYRFDMAAFRRDVIRHVAAELGQIEGRAARPDYVEGRLKDVDFAALTGLDDALGLVPEDGVYGRTIRDFLADGVNFDLLTLEVDHRLLDVASFGQIHVLYDGKPVENSSFGQRCTAVIVLLLLLGNTPIVIDEPEAHLDSALIAKYLVNLIKERKKHRQVIFATHNANFVINGDADLVHCLSTDDQNLTKVVSTTIEDLSNRDLLLSLEGGEKAFQQRERRYGIL